MKPCFRSLGLARIQGLFIYARLISQSRGSILYRAWCLKPLVSAIARQQGCWRLIDAWIARKPIIFSIVNQKASILFTVYLIIELLVKYYPNAT